MKRTDTTIIAGIALMAAGALFLLENLGFLGPLQNSIWALLFGAGGIVFLTTFWRDRTRWWALIPGFTLLSLGALIGLQDVTPAFAGAWGGALFLGGISMSFWALYLSCRRCWWALIPGGVLLTLAVVAGLSENVAGTQLGGVFFTGLALTFFLVYLAPTPAGHIRWAIYPAAVLLVMALLVMAAMGEAINFFWPAAMILAGLYLAYRAFRLQHT